MKKFETKKNVRNRLYSKTTVIVLLFIIILLIRGVFILFLRFKESKAMRIESEEKLGTILNQKELLEGDFKDLEGEGGVEMEIRRKFNVAKPGERVVVVVDDDKPLATTTEEGFFSVLWHKIWK